MPLLVSILLPLALAVAAILDGETPPKAHLYVSKLGRDTWSGTVPAPIAGGTDGPFATLERARDEIRAMRRAEVLPKHGVVVSIRKGTYERSKTFELDSGDGGVLGAPIVYEAYRGERVVLSGGVEIRGFRRVDDRRALGRIAPEHRSQILRVNLKDLGITDFGRMSARGFGRTIDPIGLELFFSGRPMQLARWPNEGFERIAGSDREGRFVYSGERPRRWKEAEDLWLHGYWGKDWADSYEKVVAIDPDRHEIATAPPHGVYGYRPGGRYYALNLLEELDRPGEWYLDRESGWLYFWPPKVRGGRLEDAAVVSLLESPLVALDGASWVTLRGLTLEHTRGVGISIRGGSDNLVERATLRNIGTIAVVIGPGLGEDGEESIDKESFRRASSVSRNAVVGCDIHDVGEGAVILAGGDRRSMAPAGNRVSDSEIRRYARWTRTYRPAVEVFGVGNVVNHNRIHDAPHVAVLLHGNDHTIELNDVHDVCRETADAGAFYLGRDLTERGNVFRHNYVHDMEGPDVQAFYLDDFTSGAVVYGNICFRTGRGVLIGGGRDNVVLNNVFVECRPAVWVDGRGLTYGKGLFDGRETTLLDRMRAVDFERPPWSERYPELQRVFEDQPGGSDPQSGP